MSSSPAYAIFDAPLQPQRPPICDAIRGLLGMANEAVEKGESNNGRNRSNEVILLDTEVDGSRYRLVRMPETNDLHKTATLVDSQFQLEMSPVNGTERRLNVGEFRRVLVAERDKAARLSLQQRLQEWGFEVVPAKHGAEALSILEQQQPPELAILSRRLPGIDGFLVRSGLRHDYLLVNSRSS